MYLLHLRQMYDITLLIIRVCRACLVEEDCRGKPGCWLSSVRWEWVDKHVGRLCAMVCSAKLDFLLKVWRTQNFSWSASGSESAGKRRRALPAGLKESLQQAALSQSCFCTWTLHYNCWHYFSLKIFGVGKWLNYSSNHSYLQHEFKKLHTKVTLRSVLLIQLHTSKLSAYLNQAQTDGAFIDRLLYRTVRLYSCRLITL